VIVRARIGEHLTNLQQRFPSLADTKVLALPGRDYGFLAEYGSLSSPDESDLRIDVPSIHFQLQTPGSCR
jgi:hypothetical protein